MFQKSQGMKMDAVPDLNGTMTPPPEPPTTHNATDIGREFVRQYYTILSENPLDVHRFYSHESSFVHNTYEAVGQQNIIKTIEEMNIVDCKVRIHSIKGAHSPNSGIVLQVTGEMQQGQDAPRPFFQTFVLCQQTPKKFYVQNDIFQFVESLLAFGEKEKEKEKAVVVPAKKPTQASPKVNGHVSVPSPPTPSPEKVDTPVAEEEIPVLPTPPKREKENKPPKREVVEPTPKPVAEPVKQLVSPPAPAEPRTWAKLVGGHKASPPSAPAPASQPPVPLRNAVVEATPVQNGQKELREDRRKSPERGSKLYIGGITRVTVPDASEEANVVEVLRSAFNKIGEVDNVHVPRKVFEKPMPSDSRTMAAFAFITMKSAAEAQKVFDACTKDDTNSYTLKLPVPQFGFDGSVSVSISEPKTSGGNRGGYRGRGQRGTFGGRGGRGRGGSFQNNQ